MISSGPCLSHLAGRARSRLSWRLHRYGHPSGISDNPDIYITLELYVGSQWDRAKSAYRQAADGSVEEEAARELEDDLALGLAGEYVMKGEPADNSGADLDEDEAEVASVHGSAAEEPECQKRLDDEDGDCEVDVDVVE